MEIRENRLQNGKLIYKVGILLTKVAFRLQKGIFALQTGLSGYNSPERACALSKVVVRVSFTTDKEPKEATLTFGCVYESNGDRVGVPWRNNGNWMLMPWDVRDLYH